MDILSNLIIVQNLLSNKRNGLLLSKIERLIVQENLLIVQQVTGLSVLSSFSPYPPPGPWFNRAWVSDWNPDRNANRVKQLISWICEVRLSARSFCYLTLPCLTPPPLSASPLPLPSSSSCESERKKDRKAGVEEDKMFSVRFPFCTKRSPSPHWTL